MRKTIRATFSGNVLNFSLPDCWEKLTQEQLRYVCFAMSKFDGVTAKTFIFLRLLGIKVLHYRKTAWECYVCTGMFKKVRFDLSNWQVHSFIRILDFIEAPGYTPVCLLRIGKYQAVNVLLRGISFREYIRIENYYQGYLQNSSADQLREMAKIMYVDKWGNNPRKIRLSDAELWSVFLWYAALKNRFSMSFLHFFGRMEYDDASEVPNMVEVMNAEIRALTGGDVTKENEVLNMDCWRALTELNEKAREAKEWREKYGRK